jgi:hypothetical protein
MNPTMNKFENTLVEMFTVGDLPELAILREQWRRARAVHRDYGPEFTTELEVPADCPRLGNLSASLSDIWANGAGVGDVWLFSLAIRDGRIDFLEGCALGDGAVVPSASECPLRYNHHDERGFVHETATGERDWDYVRMTLGAGRQSD